jgi:hypothetical protein
MSDRMTTPAPSGTAPRTGLERVARRGVWLLPVYAGLLAVSTVERQPDYGSDFPAYADFVTTQRFLLSHLVASIVGAGLAVLGTVSLAVAVSARWPGRARGALAGAAVGTVGLVVMTSVFGAAAYAQPAIGRAFLRGTPGVVDLNADVYGTPLVVMASAGLLLYMVGAVLVGRAVAHSSPTLRWPAVAYAACSVVGAVGFLVDFVAPVAALGLLVATALVALRLRRLP